MKVVISAIALGIFSIAASASQAGEIQILSSMFTSDNDSANSSNGNISLVSGGMNISKKGDANWSFTLKENDDLNAVLTIKVSDIPQGYLSTIQSFTVPYYWDADEPRTLATSIVRQDVSDDSLAEFFTQVGSGPTLVQDVALVHARAAMFWKERLKQLGRRDRIQPNADDVRVAYWLLRTTRDLVIGQYYVPDDVSISAENWIKGLFVNIGYNKRLFNQSTASFKEFNDILRSIDAKNSYLYNRIIQRLENDLTGDAKVACARIGRLEKFASQLEGVDQSEFDGEFGNSIKIKADAAFCKTKSVIASNGKG